MASVGLLMIHLSVAFTCTLAQGAEEQWSMTILVNYENGVSQRFNSILDGSFSTDYDPNLNQHGANTQSEPNYDQLCYQGIRFDIQTDAPFLNMINETDGRRETRRLPANHSPRLLGLSQVGSFIQLYVISTESGTCQSHHELKVVKFSTSYCELEGDTWCAYQGGPLTLTTGVPCSEKLPRMAIAPIDTEMMVLLDSNPQSGFLKCILVKPGQQLCSLGGDTLPKNRLENRYFFSTSSQKTLVQVHLMEHNSFVQYIIDQFSYVRLLYPSDNTEKNPQCPMLSPNIFNCTVGMKFWNGTKLVHLDGAVGEPQSFQRNGASGVAYVMQEGGESAVVVVHPLLSGGRQVLDNSAQVCRDSTAVKPVYVLGGGSVIVVARCFPNENLVFHVYLYQAIKACYELVPTRQPLQLNSGQFGRVLNVLLIGKPFLVPAVAVPSITALPPGGHSTVTPAPGLHISVNTLAATIPVLVVLLTVIVSVIVGVGIIFYCLYRKRKLIRHRRNSVGSKESLLDNEECEGQPDIVDRVRGTKSSSPPPGDGDGVVVVDIHGNLALYHDGNRRSPTRPEMTTPPAGLESTTPPAGLELTTPPSGPEMTTPPTGLESTTPPSGLELTTPPAGLELTTPPFGPEMTAPPSGLELTTPPFGPEMTAPPSGLELTTPPFGPEMTAPPSGPELKTQPTRPEMATSPTKLELTAPCTGLEMATPPTGPKLTTPPTGPELTAPTSSRSEMITPRTRPALATSQVSEVQQPQVCVHWTVQGVIPERNKAREESVLNAEEQPVEEVEAKPSVEETGSAVSELAGHEAKVTSAVQIGARTPPSGK